MRDHAVQTAATSQGRSLPALDRQLDASSANLQHASAQAGLLGQLTHSRHDLAQRTVQDLQRLHGNRYVTQLIELSRQPAGYGAAAPALQRDEAPAAPAVQESGKQAEEDGFDLGKWLHGEIYDLLKKELGEEKLKGYAKTLADQASKLLMDQVKAETPQPDSAQKAQLDLIGRLLADDVRKGVSDLISSPAGARVRQALLAKIKSDPDVAIGLVLLALGAAIAANIEVPELKKSINTGKGTKIEGEAKLGKVRDFDPKLIKLSFGYSSKYFQASIGGAYTGGDEKELAGKASASVGSSEYKFTTDASLSTGGHFKLNAGPALNLRNFGLSGTGTFDTAKGWSGAGQLRLGPQGNSLTTEVKVGADGQVTFGHTLGLTNPLGISGLSVTGSLHYRADDPVITGANLGARFSLIGSEKERERPYLLLRFDGSYTPSGPKQPSSELKGMLLLEGSIPGS